MIAESFLVPYGLLQIPVGLLLDQGRVDRWIWIAAVMASGFSLTFAFSTDLVGLMLGRTGTGVACAVAFQVLFLAVMVVVLVMALGQGLPSPEPHNHGNLAAAVHSDRAGVGKVIKACLMYAWGGGFVFGLAQYGLISGLRVWGFKRTQWMSLTMSFGIGLGMVLAGWIGNRSSRLGLVLLTGTGMSVLALIAFLQLPNEAGGLL